MAYQVLARKYRPIRFSDVVGQDHVTRTLLNALAQNRIAHGYIFSGHRGIGKTTIARILASALNCRNDIGSEIRPTPEPCNACESCLEIRQGNAVDVIEIDAATNRGIDEIRELRDAARYRPSRDRFKIYILDEAHQITDAAFNALLKTLEEPPDHIVFMMATTQPEDIPQTIRSRCQHFSFHAVKLEDIVGQLRLISERESIHADDATLSVLAEAGDGSMRDALSIMDQAIASAPQGPDGHPLLQVEAVRDLMGTVSNHIYEQVLEAVSENNSADVLAIVNRLLDAGNGPQQLARQFVRYLRNCTVAKITRLSPDAEAHGVAADLLQISPEERRRAARSATLFTEEELSRFLSIMLRTFDDLGYRQEQRFHLELGLLKLVHAQRLLPIEDLLTQLGPVPAAAPRTAPSPRATTPLSGAPQSSASATPPSAPRSAAATPLPPAATGAGTINPFASSGSSAPQPSTRQPAPSVPPGRPTPLAQAAPAPSRAEAPAPAVPAIRTPSVATAPAATLPQSAPPQPQSVPVARNTAGALALAEEPALASSTLTDGPQLVEPPPAAPDSALEVLQNAAVEALQNTKGQQSASDKLADSTWALNGDTLTIQTTCSPALLKMMFNADAERVIKATLAAHRSNFRVQFLPGSPASAGKTASKPRKAAAGSVQELAAKHPIVQQAQELFSAEIRNVIDLRSKD